MIEPPYNRVQIQITTQDLNALNPIEPLPEACRTLVDLDLDLPGTIYHLTGRVLGDPGSVYWDRLLRGVCAWPASLPVPCVGMPPRRFPRLQGIPGIPCGRVVLGVDGLV